MARFGVAFTLIASSQSELVTMTGGNLQNDDADQLLALKQKEIHFSGHILAIRSLNRACDANSR
jgi:hypothetical protein